MADVTLTTGTSWNPTDTGEITVEAWGGGGGGGAGTSASGGGGGGGGGAYAKSTQISVTAGVSVPYTIGAGASSQKSGKGDDGTSTTWNTNVCIAVGGIGGQDYAGGQGGGAGGSAASCTYSGVGSTAASGGQGGNGSSTTGGGGGEAGGTGGTGDAGDNGSAGGAGGSGVNPIGGDGGAGGAAHSNGSPGSNPGGGGGGAGDQSGGAEYGGASGIGRIDITYTSLRYTKDNSAKASIYVVNTYTKDNAVKAYIKTNSNDYYFDASDASPTDPDNAWENDINAFDGNLSTYARYPSTEQNGSTSSHFLMAEGTDALSSTSTITQVRARIYAIDGWSPFKYAAIYTDGLAQLLGTPYVTIQGSWGDYLALDTPSGGWTWDKVAALETKIYCTNMAGYSLYVNKVELEVSYTGGTTVIGKRNWAKANIKRSNETQINSAKANLVVINTYTKDNSALANLRGAPGQYAKANIGEPSGATYTKDNSVKAYVYVAQAPPSVVLDSPSDGLTIHNPSPDLKFTGTDVNYDDVVYRLQLWKYDDSTDALFFDSASSQFIRIPYASTLQPSDVVSFAGYIKKTDWTDTTQMVFTSNTESGGYSCYINQGSTNTIRWYVYANGTYNLAEYDYSGAGWEANSVHHLAGTFDGRYVKLYIDGTLQRTTDLSTSYSITYSFNTDLFVGAEPDGSTGPPSGVEGSYLDNATLTDFRLYHEALSQADIDDILDGTGYTSNLIVWLKMDEGTGTSLTDSSGNGHTSTAEGSPTWTHEDLYHEMFKVADVLSTDLTGFDDADGIYGNGVQATYTVQSILAVGTYNWRVIGKDPSGTNTWGSWATTQDFILDVIQNSAKANILKENSTQDNSVCANITDIYSVVLDSTFYGAIANFAGLDGLADDTIEGWFWNDPTSVASSGAAGLGDGTSSYYTGFTTENATGSTGINFSTKYDTSNASGYVSSGVFDQSSWVHVAVVHYGAEKRTRVIKNGQEVLSYDSISTGSTDPVSSNGFGFYLGTYGNNASGAPKWKGRIGGFIRVWNYARTCTQLFNNRNTKISGTQTGLVVNLNFSEGSGATLDNEASAGNDLTFTSTPVWTHGPSLTSNALATTLTDNFDDNSRDTSKWNEDNANSGSVDETGGQVVCTPAVSTSGSQGGYISVDNLYLSNSDASVKVVQVADTTNCYTSFEAYIDADNYYGIRVSGSSLEVLRDVGSSFTTPYTTTYNGTTHKYWRIRERGRHIYFDYSPDGITWTMAYHENNALDTSSVKFRFFAYEHTGTGTPGAAIFDDFNVHTSGAGADTLHDNFDDGTIDTGKWIEYESGGGSVDEASGQLQYSLADNTLYSWGGLYSVSAYDLTGKRFFVQITDGTGGATRLALNMAEEQLGISDTWFSIGVYTDVQKLVVKYEVGGNGVGLVTIKAITYDPDVHKYISIREDSGVTYFEYSTDGETWTELYSTDNILDVTNLRLAVDDYEYVSTTGNVHSMDNFNVITFEKTNSATANILTGATYTKDNSAKANILTTQTKDNSAIASIVTTGQQPNYVKGDILRTGETQNNSAKASIVITYTNSNKSLGNILRSGEAQNNSSKASIVHTETDNNSAKANLLKRDELQEASAKANIIVSELDDSFAKASIVVSNIYDNESLGNILVAQTKNNSAIASIQTSGQQSNYVTGNILRADETQDNKAKSSIYRTETYDNSVKAWIYRIETQNNSSKADILVIQQRNNSSTANILVVNQYSNNATADILRSDETYNNQAKASIFRTETYDNNAKSSIVRTEAYDSSSLGNILSIYEKVNSSLASIISSGQTTNNAKGNILRIDEAYNNQAKANISGTATYSNNSKAYISVIWTYEQDFNSLSTGALDGQDGWIKDAGGDFLVGNYTPYEGAKSIQLTTSSVTAYRRPVDFCTYGTVYFSVKKSNTNGELYIYLNSDYADVYANIKFDNDGKIYYYNYDTSYEYLQDWVVDTWYTIGLDVDTMAKRYRYSIDGSAWSGWITMNSDSTDRINSLNIDLLYISAETTVTIDNVSTTYLAIRNNHSKANILTTSTQDNLVIGNILRTDETYDNQVKASIVVTEANDNDAIGNILAVITKNNFALASIQTSGQIANYVTANILVVDNVANNSSKASIVRTETYDNKAKAWIYRTETQDNESKADILVIQQKQNSSVANILSAGQYTNNVVGNILRSDELNNNSVKASINRTEQYNSSVKAQIYITPTYENEAKADILATLQKDNFAKASIVTAGQHTNYVTANILRIAETHENSAKGQIYITQTHDVSVKASLVVETTHDANSLANIIRIAEAQDSFSKADILRTDEKLNNSAKASIVATNENDNNSKANILAEQTKDNFGKGQIVTSGQVFNYTIANLLRTDEIKDNSSKASIYTTNNYDNSVTANILVAEAYEVIQSAKASVGDKIYTRGTEVSLPTDDTNLSTSYTSGEISDVALDDSTTVCITGGGVLLHEFKNKNTNNTDALVLEWNGKSSVAPSAITVHLQIYNRISTTWEDVDSNSLEDADTDFTLSGEINENLDQYYDSNYWISCRVYQGV